MENQTTIREAKNVVRIVGVLSEKTFTTGVGANGEFISGKLTIRVAEGDEHTVELYANKITKNGTESKLYTSMVTIMNEYKSIAEVGEKEADKVSVTDGTLSKNVYKGKDGQLKMSNKIRANFVNRVKATEEFKPEASFQVEAFIATQAPVCNQEGEQEAIKLVVVIPNYKGDVETYDLIVRNTQYFEYIEENYVANSTVSINGDIINHVEIIEECGTSAFGRTQKTVKQNYTRELVLQGGSEPYEEENESRYSVELITKAILAMKERHTEILNKEVKAATPQAQTGFGVSNNSGATAAPSIGMEGNMPFY